MDADSPLLSTVAKLGPKLLHYTIGVVAPELRHYITYVKAIEFYTGESCGR